MGVLAARFAVLDLARVVSSPPRAVPGETAGGRGGREPVRVSVTVDEGLRECAYGAWTGRLIRELHDDPPGGTVQDQPSAACSTTHEHDAESLLAMAHRAVGTIRRHDAEVAAEHGPHAAWVAVTHGDIIKAVLADAVGSHVDHFQRFRADPASVSVVQYTERRPFLVAPPARTSPGWCHRPSRTFPRAMRPWAAGRPTGTPGVRVPACR